MGVRVPPRAPSFGNENAPPAKTSGAFRVTPAVRGGTRTPAPRAASWGSNAGRSFATCRPPAQPQTSSRQGPLLKNAPESSGRRMSDFPAERRLQSASPSAPDLLSKDRGRSWKALNRYPSGSSTTGTRCFSCRMSRAESRKTASSPMFTDRSPMRSSERATKIR